MALQIWGVVLFGFLWLLLGSLGLITYLVVRKLEPGVKEGKYVQGL